MARQTLRQQEVGGRRRVGDISGDESHHVGRLEVKSLGHVVNDLPTEVILAETVREGCLVHSLAVNWMHGKTTLRHCTV